VGLAQTGTGKTAAFGLPLVELVEEDEPYTQALVLAPTRELCLQVSNELTAFGKKIKKLRITAVYGGTDIGRQIKELKRGAQIVVATPGRLRDLINRKAINLRELSYLVLDEADEMLNMGFKEEIDDILKNTPEDKLTWLFSATMPAEVRRIASDYMVEPLEVSAGRPNTSNANIDHQYVMVRRHQKYPVLRRFLDFDPDCFGLVFTRTRRDAHELAEQLAKDGYRADSLHGDMSQAQRDHVMQRFRDQRLQILVATDVAARGIDVQEITHVFHYNIPDDLAFYTHRSGRTGRAGNEGISLVIANPKDRGLLRNVERRLKISFSEAHIPTGEAICARRLLHEVRHLKEIPIQEDLETYIPGVSEELEALTREDLIRKITALTFRGPLQEYLNAPDFNNKNGGHSHRDRDQRHGSGSMDRLFINVGQIDLNGKGEFLRLVCDAAQINGSAIGRIDFRAKHTFFDVDQEVTETVIQKLGRMDLDGRSIRVNRDGGRSGGKKGNKGKRHGYKKKSSRGRSYA
jgi:ATP-dependent RNA helicase DeaD